MDFASFKQFCYRIIMNHWSVLSKSTETPSPNSFEIWAFKNTVRITPSWLSSHFLYNNLRTCASRCLLRLSYYKTSQGTPRSAMSSSELNIHVCISKGLRRYSWGWWTPVVRSFSLYISPRDSESHKLTIFSCLMLNAERENERKLQHYAAFHRQGKKETCSWRTQKDYWLIWEQEHKWMWV